MQTLILSFIGSILVVVFVLWLVAREHKKNRFSAMTETMLRSPGYSLNNQLQDKKDQLLEPILTLCFLPYLFTHLLKDVSFETRIVAAVLLLVPIVWALRKISHLYQDIRKLKFGLEGVVYTGQELNHLMRTGAWVYHDIPYNYGNIGHIIVSKAGIFTVETEAVSTPMNDRGVNDAKVIVKDGSLVFPHFTTAEPIEQAKRHARQVRKFLFEKTGVKYPVVPTIALPGWSVVNSDKSRKGFLVVNPKRGVGLERYMGTERIAINDLNKAFTLIDAVARSASTNTDITDPDAKKSYSFSKSYTTTTEALIK